MHGCGHHIKVLTHSYNIGVGHIGPQHGIDHTAVIKILSSYHCRTHSHYHHHDTYQKSSHYIIVFIAKNIIVLSLFHGPLRINRAEALVNWEVISYVFDTLDDSPYYRLEGGTVYGKGQWATSLRYHDGMFYVLFSPNDHPYRSYIYKTADPAGEWTQVSRTDHFHDSSLLFDEIAQLTTRAALRPCYDEQIILAVVLDGTAPLMQPGLKGVTINHTLLYTVGFYSAEIRLQFGERYGS